MDRREKWDKSLAPLLIERGADVNYGLYFRKPLIQAIGYRIIQPVPTSIPMPLNLNAQLLTNLLFIL